MILMDKWLKNIEKPKIPPSNIAITGLYFVDSTAPKRPKSIKPSHCGELEITSLLEVYLKDKSSLLTQLSKGIAWRDTGTQFSSGHRKFVRILTEKQGLQSGSKDELAYRLGYINKAQLVELLKSIPKANIVTTLSS